MKMVKKRQMISKEVIIRAQNGDESAFTEIYQVYFKYVCYVVNQFFNNNGSTEDIAQEVFIKVHQKINELKEPKAFHSWIRRITYTKCINQYNKNSKIKDLGEDMDIDDFGDNKQPKVSEVIDRKQLMEIVGKSLSTMKPTYKSVGMLRYFEGLKIDEIASILEIPRGTVNSRLTKVRESLKKELKKEGISPRTYGLLFLSPSFFINAYRMLYKKSLGDDSSIAIGSKGKATTRAKALMISTTIIVAAVISSLLYNPKHEAEVTSKTMEIKKEVQIEKAKIKDIIYDTNWRNQKLDVEIETTNKEYDRILINGVETNEILENGTYICSLEKDGETIDEKEIVVSNIDYNSPTGYTQSDQNNYFVIRLNDDLSNVNPNNITLLIDGIRSEGYMYDEQTNLLSIQCIEGKKYILYVGDYAGNILEIEIK
ncbi:RNA polymerase sigma factor (sigma-70 family) [Breznakia sp. PF5-3]|uniref:RNA polymerase sigma factor n=1 Tax=unclassified Breznakia TaxID=2623764 RepID=UPI002404F233|nr:MULTISPECIES: RNA polymerase sigma factor [unclassified Breznakia]MDF9825499.1 RNA polymerase sigma factor (sigma-70 family) [Breznakia sp. PM6-1]MDF9836379.1 RNA polymerase sigma factor (sigma-70 family) [Breznakia sp. PF5-3]MDF9837495.1 RNA polymerase sigma factor (sigma-70 family) [Breznakia sp. PFB2-8]MDF9859442.1 RNA polymerase sigma factor (sigma-70 family) [Breznakia sp. PH5-24]